MHNYNCRKSTSQSTNVNWLLYIVSQMSLSTLPTLLLVKRSINMQLLSNWTCLNECRENIVHLKLGYWAAPVFLWIQCSGFYIYPMYLAALSNQHSSLISCLTFMKICEYVNQHSSIFYFKNAEDFVDLAELLLEYSSLSKMIFYGKHSLSSPLITSKHITTQTFFLIAAIDFMWRMVLNCSFKIDCQIFNIYIYSWDKSDRQPEKL